jgi:hypothetical protein
MHAADARGRARVGTLDGALSDNPPEFKKPRRAHDYLVRADRRVGFNAAVSFKPLLDRAVIAPIARRISLISRLER